MATAGQDHIVGTLARFAGHAVQAQAPKMREQHRIRPSRDLMARPVSES
jgi:hypothetical protein